MRKRYFLYVALSAIIAGMVAGGVWFWTQRLSQSHWWEEALFESLGQDVNVEGTVETHFAFSSSIDITSVRFADGFWVPRLEVHFDPWAILQGKSQVSGLTFHGFEGSLNPVSTRLSAFEFFSSEGFPVLTFVDGTLTVGETETVRIPRATLRPGKGDNALNAEGTAFVQGQSIRFSGTLGKKSAANETHALTFSLSSILGRFRFSGEINPHLRARGRAEIRAATLAPLWRFFENEMPIPASLDQEVLLEGDLVASAREIGWENIRLRSGAFLADGSLKLAFEEGVKVAIEGNIPYLNLSGLPLDGFSLEEEWQRLFRLPKLPDSLAMDFVFRIPSLSVKQGVVRNARISGAYAQDEIRFHALSAVLPGGATLSALGTLRPGRLDLALEAASDDMRLLLEWGGVDTSAFPPGRLHHLWVRGGIRATPSEINLFPFNVEIDAIHIDAGATIVPAARPAFGLSFVADRLPLEIYAPAPFIGNDLWGKFRTIAPAADFNIKGSLGTLSHEALSVDNVSLALSALDGAIRWDAFGGDDEAETMFRTEGELVFLEEGDIIIEKGRISGRVPAPLSSFLRGTVSVPLLDSSLGAFVFSVEGEGPGDRLDLRVSGELDGLQMRGQGQIKDGASSSLTATLAATHASLPRVAELLGVPWPKGGAGGFAISAHLESDFTQAFLSDLRLRLGPVNLVGKADLRWDAAKGPPRLGTSLYAATIPLDLFAPADRPHSVVPLRDWVGAPAARTPQWMPALSPMGQPFFDTAFSPHLLLDIILDAEHLSFGDVFIPSPHLVFRSEATRASLDLSSRAFFGGNADMSMTALRRGNDFTLDGRVSILGLDVHRIDPVANQTFFQNGTLDLSLSLQGRGESLGQAAEKLAGNGQARFNDVVLGGIDFSMMKKEQREGDGFPSLQRLFSGQSALVSLDVSLASTGGLLEAKAPLSFEEEESSGVLYGKLDVGERMLNAVLSLRFSEDETAPPVCLVWNGPWTKLVRRIETQTFDAWRKKHGTEASFPTERERPSP